MKILTGYQCLNCFVSQIDKIASSIGKTEKEKKEIFLKSINFLSNIENFDFPPPEIARKVYSFIREFTRTDDPFKRIKEETNLFAEKLVTAILQKHPDISLKKLLKYTVAGNIIDYGVGKNKTEFKIEQFDNIKLNLDDADLFFEELNRAQNLLYILDNSGEVVIDKYFLEKLKEKYSNLKVYIAVRNNPIINDITLEDAIELGLQNIGTLISTGYDGPGVMLEQTSEEFKDIFYNSDIVVSKGQGNFETLWGCDRKIFYALKIKCEHVAKISGFELNSNLFICR